MLLDADFNLKLCDFGMAASIDETLGAETKNISKTIYSAPEMLQTQGKYSFAVDVWSLGVIFYYLYCGYFPFSSNTP